MTQHGNQSAIQSDLFLDELPPGFTLKAFQQKGVDAIFNCWDIEKYLRVLCVMPTGTGKTVLFAHVSKILSGRGERILVVADREELLGQAQQKMWEAAGVRTTLEQARSTANMDCNVVVASVSSLHEKRIQKFSLESSFDTVIIDEGHHALAPKYRRLLKQFKHAKFLLVTATPNRADKKSLAKVVDTLAYEYSLREAIQEKNLVPIKIKMLPIEVDLSQCEKKKTTGEYDTAGLGRILNPHVLEIAEEIKNNIGDRKTILFAPLRATSELMSEALRRVGIHSVHVDGDSPERRNIIRDFRQGNKYQVITNAMLLTEGFDCPEVSCIVPLRPTKSTGLYQQMIGRGTRLAPNKSDLLVLDFLWQSPDHDLCTPASLVAGTEHEKEDIEKALRLGGGSPVQDILDVQSDTAAKREQKLIEEVKKNAQRKARVVSPFDLAVALDDDVLKDYEPVYQWEKKKATEKQLQLLARFGVDTDHCKYRGHASILLDRIFRRKQLGLCTPKQARFLLGLGIKPDGISAKRAGEIISEHIKANQ